jgi:mycothiol synthase
MSTAHEQQLHMLWPASLLAQRPAPVTAPGYELRTYRPGDEDGYLAVMRAAGFNGFDEEMVATWVTRALPDGLFFVAERATGLLVATALATHRPTALHPFGGELGWVAVRPQHRGRRLGTAVCAAATARLLDAGYRRVYLQTDDWRLPALLTYLRLGYVPFLYAADMAERWQSACEALSWPYTPEAWPGNGTEAAAVAGL